MADRTLPAIRVGRTVVSHGNTQVETILTLNNPLPLATGPNGEDIYQPDDAPEAAGHLFVTVVTMDIENEQTEQRWTHDTY